MSEERAEYGTDQPRGYVGIDNGISGAIAYVLPHGHLVDWLPMPIQRSRRGNEVNVVELWAAIRYLTGGDAGQARYVVEEPGGSKSAKACASMSGSFHAIRALLQSRGMVLHRVTPKAWQQVMLPGCRKGDTKPRALELATRLWPDEQWHATYRCTTPHDGGIDAALIAEWARRGRL